MFNLNRNRICFIDLFILFTLTSFLVGGEPLTNYPPAGSMEAYANGLISESVGNYSEAFEHYQFAATLDSESLEPFVKMLEMKIMMGDVNGIIETAELLMERGSEDMELRKKLTTIYVEMGYIHEAIPHLEWLKENEPNNPDNYINLANMYVSMIPFHDIDEEQAKKNIDKALGILKDAEKAFKNDTKTLKIVADFYLHTYSFDRAEKVFKRILDIDENFNTAHLGLALIYEQKGKLKKAAKEYENYFEKEPIIEDILISYLATLAKMDKIEKAIEAGLSYLEENPESYVITRRVGFLLMADEQTERSVGYLEKAFELNPDDVNLPLYIAEIYNNRDDVKQAKSFWLKYLEKVPEVEAHLEYYHFLLEREDTVGLVDKIDSLSEANPNHTEILLFEASYYSTIENLDKALELFFRVFEIQPDNVASLFGLADTYERMGERSNAIDYLKEALLYAPESAPLLNYLGYLLADSNLDLEYAEELIELALEQDPENGAYLDSYAWVMYRMNKNKKALKYIEKALSYVSDDPTIYDHKGDILVRLEKEKKALENYKKALELSKEETLRNKIQEKINSLANKQ